MFKITCQQCGEECKIDGYISAGIQGSSLISINTSLETEGEEVTGETRFECQRCGNTVYFRI